MASVAVGSLLTMVGAAVAGGVFWLLLSVPESNVFALLLSALLVLLLTLLSGYVASVVLSVAGGLRVAPAAARGVRGLPGFLVGVALFAALWWVTSSIDQQWTLHRGEIDALFLRYIGTANTGWVHTAVAWTLWLVRWGVGLSLVCGTTAASVARAGLRRGVGVAFSPLPLGTSVAALVVGCGLWSLAYWHPKSLPANTVELVFVTAKLSVLFILAAVIVTLVFHAFARASAATALPPWAGPGVGAGAEVAQPGAGGANASNVSIAE